MTDVRGQRGDIDLGHGRLLTELFDLELEPVAPDLVLDELVSPDRKTLEQLGLRRRELPAKTLIIETNDIHARKRAGSPGSIMGKETCVG